MTEDHYFSADNVRLILNITDEDARTNVMITNMIDFAHYEASQFCEKDTDEYKCRFKQALLKRGR